MNQELEQKILQLAVERKILSGEDLQKARREWQESSERASGPTSALVDLLVERGLLQRSAVERLTEEILSSSEREAVIQNRARAGGTPAVQTVAVKTQRY
jgi:hypothetical protein